MKIFTKIAAICAVCLSTSLAAFSQAAIQPSDKTVAVSKVTTKPESTETVEPKTEETKATPKRQSSGDAENWRGFYIGGNVGGTVSRNSLVTSALDCGGFTGINTPAGLPTTTNGCGFSTANVPAINQIGNQETKPKGFTGGVQAGYNFQASNFVAGVETDFNSFRQNNTVSAQQTPVRFPIILTQTLKTNWLMTLRPRAGFTAGRALIYGTGGLAVTNINYQASLSQPFVQSLATGLGNVRGYALADSSIPIKQTKAGWTAGGGAEFKINDHWSFKGEYLYTQFKANGQANQNLTVRDFDNAGVVSATFAVSTPNSFLNSDVKLKSHHFRFGVNYRF